MKRIKAWLRTLNILDYSLILLLFAGILFYFLHFKRETNYIYVDVFSPSPEWTQDTYPMNRWQTSALKKGDVAYNSFGDVIAEVLSVYRAPWNAGRQEYLFARLKLKATYSKNTKIYSFNGNPLLIGNKFVLDANSTSLEGKVVAIYTDENELQTRMAKKSAVITVLYKSLEPWVVDKFLTKKAFYNDDGALMFRITNFSVTPAKDYFPNWQGQLTTTIHPVNKDIVATFEIPQVDCSGYTCFYNHYFPLAVGWEFPVDFGDLLIIKDTTILTVTYNE